MIEDILTIHVSIVAYILAFSTSGWVLDNFESSLTHKLVKAFICTQDGFKAYERPPIVEESLDKLENFEEYDQL